MAYFFPKNLDFYRLFSKHHLTGQILLDFKNSNFGYKFIAFTLIALEHTFFIDLIFFGDRVSQKKTYSVG